MRDEAKANEEKDKAEKERIEKINAADSNIFATEKQLKEYGDKIPADKKSAIEGALAKLKEAHKNQDVAAIDTAINELNAAWQAASQDLYAAQQAQQQHAQHHFDDEAADLVDHEGLDGGAVEAVLLLDHHGVAVAEEYAEHRFHQHLQRQLQIAFLKVLQIDQRCFSYLEQTIRQQPPPWERTE